MAEIELTNLSRSFTVFTTALGFKTRPPDHIRCSGMNTHDRSVEYSGEHFTLESL